MPYLTPDEVPDNATCRALFIPNNEQYLAIVRGALQELTFSYNWTKYGAVTPEEAANSFIDMFDRFSFNEGTCRVIGEIIQYAGESSPNPNWLICDGSDLLKADYPDLFAVCGTNYGLPLDPAKFRIPNLIGRTAIGAGDDGSTFWELGTLYGEDQHTLTVDELPPHTHSVDGHITLPALIGEVPATAEYTTPSISGSTGLGQPFSLLQPSIPITFLIVARDG